MGYVGKITDNEMMGFDDKLNVMFEQDEMTLLAAKQKLAKLLLGGE